MPLFFISSMSTLICSTHSKSGICTYGKVLASESIQFISNQNLCLNSEFIHRVTTKLCNSTSICLINVNNQSFQNSQQIIAGSGIRSEWLPQNRPSYVLINFEKRFGCSRTRLRNLETKTNQSNYNLIHTTLPHKGKPSFYNHSN